MRIVYFIGGIALLGILVVLFLQNADAVMQWAVTAQRGIQNEMAGAIRSLQAGEVGALLALLTAAGAYGFFHAVGPGHGKFLIAGVGMGSQVSSTRLLGLSLASSLAQSVWAIVLVYGGFWIFEVSAQQLTFIAEKLLSPLSYFAIGSIGAVLIWRGSRSLFRQRDAIAMAGHTHAHAHAHDHDHDHGHGRGNHHGHVHDEDCGCHSHGPTPQQVAEVTSLREALALTASIAVRPCTGAIFLLVIAWQLDIKFAGVLAVMVMGMGTAALVSLVAVSSVVARQTTLISAHSSGLLRFARPSLEIGAGFFILWMSVALFGQATL
ncbi:MAG: hypothetical protein AAGI10_11365 [Pseudomonadota bacterium]